jgi:hypothetical protein
MRRICKQELLEMAKANGKGEWSKKFAETVKMYMYEYPNDSDMRKKLTDGGVKADCIEGLLELSSVGGYATINLHEGELPANIYVNYVYSMWVSGDGDATGMYNKLLGYCGAPFVDKIGENGEGFYTRDNDKVLDGEGGKWELYNNTFTEIFRHSFGIEEVYLAFLLCDEDLETFYEFVGYGTEPAPKPEPSDLPEDRQTLVGDLYAVSKPIDAMYEMLEANKPIDKVALTKCISQLDMKCKMLSADFENILNM